MFCCNLLAPRGQGTKAREVRTSPEMGDGVGDVALYIFILLCFTNYLEG